MYCIKPSSKKLRFSVELTGAFYVQKRFIRLTRCNALQLINTKKIVGDWSTQTTVNKTLEILSKRTCFAKPFYKQKYLHERPTWIRINNCKQNISAARLFRRLDILSTATASQIKLAPILWSITPLYESLQSAHTASATTGAKAI